MSITFPTTLDSLTDMTPTNSLGAEGHNTRHTDLNSAVEALEAKVGVDNSAVTSSHDYKIAALESTDSTHTTNIATNATNIATNTTNITSNDTDIANHLGYLEDGWIPSGETWTYASADDPTFTFTITGDKTTKYYKGMRIKVTNDGSVKYFIITDISYSAPDTTVTIYGGTSYDLANAAITNPFYSMCKMPAGFNVDPDNWTVSTSSSANNTQATPVQNTWYNAGTISLSIPIGVWYTSYETVLYVTDTSATIVDVEATLSTANNTESDTQFTARLYKMGASANTQIMSYIRRQKILDLSSKASYYLNIRSQSAGMATIAFRGADGDTIVRAICAYL